MNAIESSWEAASSQKTSGIISRTQESSANDDASHCASESSRRLERDPFLGATLPGGYLVAEFIGAGGMGRVYRAEQQALGRSVAVKFANPVLRFDERIVGRFVAEARAASRINHPNSVSIIDFGRTASGFVYIIMEYLRGRDLARIIAQDGFLPLSRSVSIVRQVLAVLDEAHHLDVIHRDLKPENVFLVDNSRVGRDFVKVVDFGLATVLDDPAFRGLSECGRVCGTPEYMPPERGRGEPSDARSDLYSVGVILFQLLTGQLPFDGPTAMSIVLKHITDPVPDPCLLAPHRDIPPALAQIAMRALCKSPCMRFQSAQEMSLALEEISLVTSSPPRSGPRSAGSFCIDCGSRLGAGVCPQCSPKSISSPPSANDASTHPTTVARVSLPSLSYDEELYVLFKHFVSVTELRIVRVSGGPGMGKTRLMDGFAAAVESHGNRVLRCGLDPWNAGVAYHPICQLVARLLGIGTINDESPVLDSAPSQARAGLEVLRGRTSLQNASPRGVRFLVAEALLFALSFASNAAPGKLAIVVDDFDRIDGASRNALLDLVSVERKLPIFLILCHEPSFCWKGPSSASEIRLHGIRKRDLSVHFDRSRRSFSFPKITTDTLIPLFVQHAVHAGDDGIDVSLLNGSLADLLAQRIASLTPEQLRFLQAVSVLGDSVHVSDACNLSKIDDPLPIVRSLALVGLLIEKKQFVAVSHPLLREFVEQSAPAECRRILHDAASELALDAFLPLEVRANHAMRAYLGDEALVLIERVGSLCLARGDVDGAVAAFRRGLDYSRREISRGLIEDPMHAVVVFSCKLAEALVEAGDLVGADGIIQEALASSSPIGLQKAKALAVLARIASMRGRHEDALAHYRGASSLALAAGEMDFVATLRVAEQAMRHSILPKAPKREPTVSISSRPPNASDS